MPPEMPGAARPVRPAWREALRLRNAGVVYALLLIVAAVTVVSAALGRPNYLAGPNLANILEQTSLIAILAVFMTITLISGNFDLSVGSVAAFAAAVFLLVVDSQPLPTALLAALAAGGLLGLLNGAIVQLVGINAFIVTLGTLTAVRGLVLILTDARTITARSPGAREAMQVIEGGRWTVGDVLVYFAVGFLLVAAVLWWSSGKRLSLGALLSGGVGMALAAVSLAVDWTWSLAKPVWYLFAITAGCWAVLRFTVVGRRLHAVGGNAEAARLSGININRYRITAFVLNGLAAGFVGVLAGAQLGAVNPTGLQGTELTVIAAAILGGTSLFGGSGSIVKSVCGALILFSLGNAFNVLNLGATYQGLIEGSVIIIAAAVYTVASRSRTTKRGLREGDEDGAAPAEPSPVIANASRAGSSTANADEQAAVSPDRTAGRQMPLERP